MRKENREDPGRREFNEWRGDRSVASVVKAIGDTTGQVAKWASGVRKTLPYDLRVRLSAHTGIPLEQFMGEEERRIHRIAVALTARDAAGDSAA